MQGRKFVALLPTEASRCRLQKLADRLGLNTGLDHSGNPTNEFEFHMTLLYSEDENDYPAFTMPAFHPIRANGAVVMPLGPKATVVRTTLTKRLQLLRDQIIRDLKLKHYYDDWVPHVSLSYDPASQPKDAIPTWYFPIFFDRITVRTSE